MTDSEFSKQPREESREPSAPCPTCGADPSGFRIDTEGALICGECSELIQSVAAEGGQEAGGARTSLPRERVDREAGIAREDRLFKSVQMGKSDAPGAGRAFVRYGKFSAKGMIAFACPVCSRPIWVKSSLAGKKTICEGCHAKLLAPVPETGQVVKILDNPQKRHGDAGAGPGNKTELPPPREQEAPLGNVSEEKAMEPPSGEPVERDPVFADLEDEREDYPFLVDSLDPVGLEGEGEGREDRPGEARRPLEKVIQPEGDAILGAEDERGTHSSEVSLEKKKKYQLKKRKNWSPRKSKKRVKRSRHAPGKDLEGWELNPSKDKARQKRERIARKVQRIGTALLILAVGSVIYFSLASAFRKSSEDIVPAAASRETKPESQEILLPPPEYLDEVRDAIDGFFKAESLDEKARYVRTPEKALPGMRRYYAGVTDLSTPYEFDGQATYDSSGEQLFVFVQVLVDHVKPRAVALERSGGRFLVDWESFVGYSETPWENFLGPSGVDSGVFRVLVTIDDYYNLDFADSSRYLCLKIADLDDTQSCFGYVERDSVDGRLIEQVLSRNLQFGAPAGHLMLELRFPEGAPARHGLASAQVEVVKMVRDNWLVR